MPFHITGLPAMATAAATSGPTTLLANNGSAVSPSSFDPAPSSVSVLPTSRILSIVARQDPTIQLRQKIFLENTSPHILLINTHGYAGPKVPMGATDTGGQITYIHRKAVELAKLGYKVTIATRAFRPPPELEEFGTRQGIDFLPGSDGKVRYVFVEGMEEDRASFLPKEGIYADLPAIAHNLAEFIAEEAATAGLSPWEYFTWFESHYVDAGIVGQHLVRIWAHQIAAQYLKERFGPILGEDLSVNSFRKEGNLMGALSYYFGRRVLTLWREEHPGKNQFTAKEILLWAVSKLHWPKSYRATLIEGLEDKSQNAQQLVWEIGNRLMNVAGDTTDLGIILANINRHVFTPHSLGKLKEERMRLSGEAFRERTAFLSMNFPGRERAERSLLSGADILFANLPPSAVVVSTSDEVTDTAYRLGMSPARTLLRFEPGSDEEMYHPRPNMEDPDVSALFHHLEETGVVPKEILDCIRTAPQKFQIIVEAGRMDATKRKHILIRAMTHLPKNTLLFIAGPRDNKGVYDFLSNEIERLELKERVFLLGML
ncbi:MAG: hypothetical protein Q7T03_10435, partial [Deltaproteobacteria bacterium]|nr:hypothetical protein [Deltaproteobacteria bacterium]